MFKNILLVVKNLKYIGVLKPVLDHPITQFVLAVAPSMVEIVKALGHPEQDIPKKQWEAVTSQVYSHLMDEFRKTATEAEVVAFVDALEAVIRGGVMLQKQFDKMQLADWLDDVQELALRGYDLLAA